MIWFSGNDSGHTSKATPLHWAGLAQNGWLQMYHLTSHLGQLIVIIPLRVNKVSADGGHIHC